MRPIDWTSYASVYDLMAASNPAYCAIVATLERELTAWRLDSGANLLDLGSGTGNFSLPLAKAFGSHRVLCVDSDPAMNEEARRKADELGLRNLETVEADIERVDLAPGTLAGIVCVHALYTLVDPASMIRRMYEWTRPGGHVFACDLGRVLALGDWSAYLFKELTRRHGLLEALSIVSLGRAPTEDSVELVGHSRADVRVPRQLPPRPRQCGAGRVVSREEHGNHLVPHLAVVHRSTGVGIARREKHVQKVLIARSRKPFASTPVRNDAEDQVVDEPDRPPQLAMILRGGPSRERHRSGDASGADIQDVLERGVELERIGDEIGAKHGPADDPKVQDTRFDGEVDALARGNPGLPSLEHGAGRLNDDLDETGPRDPRRKPVESFAGGCARRRPSP